MYRRRRPRMGLWATQCRQPARVHSFAARREPPRAAAAHVTTAPAEAPLHKQQQAAERLRFGFPKGSLQKSTHELFKKAGAGLREAANCYMTGKPVPSDVTALRPLPQASRSRSASADTSQG